MRVGVTLLPERPWVEDRERWIRAERFGFDHAWTFDHLAWRSLADSAWYATMPTLTAAALATTRLRIGTWVTTPNFRHPVPLAKELMTLDSISEGRIVVGIGAGAPGWDASMLGQQPLTAAQLMHRFDEFVTLLDLLLTQRRTSWEGEWYKAVDARNVPGPVQQPRPPFVVAANRPKAIALAVAKGEGWATAGTASRDSDEAAWWDGAGEASRICGDALAGTGRRADSIERYLNLEALSSSLTSVEQFRDQVGRAAELGFTDVVIAWPRSDGPFAGDEKVLEAIADELDTAPGSGRSATSTQPGCS
jgi:alkanesulfonate monooxygenase SsuD/methylene tetrahydromethanopterin reductase-like flavin-dependent oxidoreductase (luciferase family)